MSEAEEKHFGGATMGRMTAFPLIIIDGKKRKRSSDSWEAQIWGI